MTTNQCQSKRNLRSKDLLCLHLWANCYYRVLVCTVFLYLCYIWYPWLCIFVASNSVRDQMAWQPTRVRATEGERVNVNGAEKVLKKQPCNVLLGARLESGTSAQTARSKLQAMKHAGGSIQGREGGWKWIWDVIWANEGSAAKVNTTVSFSF